MGRGFNPERALSKVRCRQAGAEGKHVRHERTVENINSWLKDRQQAVERPKTESLTDKLIRENQVKT